MSQGKRQAAATSTMITQSSTTCHGGTTGKATADGEVTETMVGGETVPIDSAAATSNDGVGLCRRLETTATCSTMVTTAPPQISEACRHAGLGQHANFQILQRM